MNAISSAMSDISFHIYTALDLFVSDPHLHYLRVLALLVISPRPLQVHFDTFTIAASPALHTEVICFQLGGVSLETLSMYMIHK